MMNKKVLYFLFFLLVIFHISLGQELKENISEINDDAASEKENRQLIGSDPLENTETESPINPVDDTPQYNDDAPQYKDDAPQAIDDTLQNDDVTTRNKDDNNTFSVKDNSNSISDIWDSDTFIEPTSLSKNEDGFLYEKATPKIDYIFVNNPLPFSIAGIYCKSVLKGSLAIVDTFDKAYFLAEALSETNMEFDNLWINGKIINNRWYWHMDTITRKPLQEHLINSTLLELFMVKRSENLEFASYHNRSCLAFNRQNHEQPHYVDLYCNMLRPFICERGEFSIGEKGESIHSGWIKVHSKQFKIFYDRISYNEANEKCFEKDQESKLAFIEDMQEVNTLGRYLLIGRPSLENAWIQARFDNERRIWTYPDEEYDLSMKTPMNLNEFPPWRLHKHVKRAGCALLDRHISNTTRFLEAQCNRLRSYICYKRAESEITGLNNSIEFPNMGDSDYVLYFEKLSWTEAQMQCKAHHGWLAEPKNDSDINMYLYFMGENRTAAEHLWLGGHFEKNHWVYSHSNRIVPKLGGWVNNNTYLDIVEKQNVCLNLDRENHNTPIVYGTYCMFPQAFLCQYKKGTLEKQ